MRKKIWVPVLIFSLAISLVACGKKDETQTTVKSFLSEEQSQSLQSSDTDIVQVEYKDSDEYFDYDSSATIITLSKDSASTSGEGAEVKAGEITISKEGTYVLKGEFNGSVVVEADEKANVYIVLENATITAKDGPAIYEKSADKVVLLLPKGTDNYAEDAAAYADTSENAPTAAIYCKDSLTINGEGKLTVKGNNNDAITSKAKLKIMSGTVAVTSADDGIVGKNLVAIKSGNITVNAGGDGIKATNDADEEKGNILVEGGNITIVAAKDAIQAERNISIKAGNISVTTGDGAGEFTASSEGFGKNPYESSKKTASSGGKGLKASQGIAVSGGNLTFNTADDAIHSDDTVVLANANITIAAKDDAVHSETTLVISGGTYEITQCEEGLESTVIYINSGEVNIVASDDGINAMGGTEGAFSGFGSKQEESSEDSEDAPYVIINGGNICVNAYGDGIDSNGYIEINGGYVFVSGSTDSANNATDYASKFYVNGGTVIACGSSGMYQTISTGSKCVCIDYLPSGSMAAGTKVVLTSQNTEVVSFELLKDANAILISGDILAEDGSYSISVNGTSEEVSVSTGSETSGGFGGFGGQGGFGGKEFGGKDFGGDFDPSQFDGEFNPEDISGGDFTPPGREFKPGDGTGAPEGFTPPAGTEKPEREGNTGEGNL